jgi:hypothetical protein
MVGNGFDRKSGWKQGYCGASHRDRLNRKTSCDGLTSQHSNLNGRWASYARKRSQLLGLVPGTYHSCKENENDLGR